MCNESLRERAGVQNVSERNGSTARAPLSLCPLAPVPGACTYPSIVAADLDRRGLDHPVRSSFADPPKGRLLCPENLTGRGEPHWPLCREPGALSSMTHAAVYTVVVGERTRTRRRQWATRLKKLFRHPTPYATQDLVGEGRSDSSSCALGAMLSPPLVPTRLPGNSCHRVKIMRVLPF